MTDLEMMREVLSFLIPLIFIELGVFACTLHHTPTARPTSTAIAQCG